MAGRKKESADTKLPDLKRATRLPPAITYWSDRGGWPRRTLTHIPLAEAVIKIGEAMFGDAWTGLEPLTTFAFRLPAQENASKQDTMRAHELLASNPKYSPNPSCIRMVSLARLDSSVWIDRYQFTIEDWAKALDLSIAEEEGNKPAALRFAAAKTEFLRAATMGELSTAVRSPGSTAMIPLEADIWSVVRRESLFVCCEINPQEPDSMASAGGKFMPVFVTEESMAKKFASSPANTACTRPQDAPPAAISKGIAAAALETTLDGPPLILRHGKQPGESWQHGDVPAFIKMAHLLDAEGLSVSAAADRVAPEFTKSGKKPTSTAKRLKDYYPRWASALRK